MTFDEILDQAIEMLQRRKRVSYRALKLQFQLDDEYLDVLKEELIDIQGLAVDQDSRMLVWTGETEAQPVSPSQPTQTSKQPNTQQDQPTPIELPPEPPTPNAERRQLTVMFCDLADSTRLSSQLDPEDLRDVIRAYQSTSAEVIERYDGYIAQHLGDGLMVYFGWPQAHEDDARRAVHAGLGIVEAMQKLNARLEQEKGFRLAVRIGIHTGLVVVGEIGKGASQEHLALGETPNIASRIESFAESDTLAISAVTCQLVQGYFVCDDLGQYILRGVDEPQQVYRVVREGDVQSRFDVAAARGLAPLVGRESECALLFDRWQQVKDGHGQVVLLSGEAGIGKSRLLQVLRDHVSDEPLIQLECRSSPYYQNTALYPITDLLQRIWHWRSDDTSETKLEKLEQMLQQYRLPLPETVPLFATLLSLPLPKDHYPPLNLSPQQQRQKTLESVVALLLAQAEQQPVLFILEDLHWTDPTTLDLLDLLIGQIPTAAICVLLTCRPAFQPTWSSRSYLSQVALNRLSQNQIESMAERVVGGKRLPAEVKQQLVDKTDGVPLFVEEMTKAVLESGLVKEVDGQYELAGSSSALAIPATLQDSLMARLDRLVTAKGVAQYAAVIGRQFSYELLQAVAQLDGVVLQNELGSLVEAELLYQRNLPPQAIYTFKHALIRDAAYASLLVRRRRELHQAVGGAIETLYSNRLADYDEELSYHFTLGELWPKAMTYSTLAGDRAADAHAYAEARVHYTRALEAAAHLDPTPDLLALANLHEKHAHVLAFFIEYEAAAAEYQQALALVRQVGERQRESRLLAALSLVYNFSHHPEAAITCIDQALAIAEQLDNRPRQASCLIGRASIRTTYYGQVVEALSESEEALRLARAVGDSQLVSRALCNIGGILEYSADFDRSLTCLYESAELAQGVRSIFVFSYSAMFIGFANIARGAYEEALLWLQRLQDYASEIDDAFWLSRVPNTIAAIPLDLYDLDEAIRLNLEGADVAQRLWPWPEPHAHALLKVGLAHLERDEHGLADEFFQRTWSLLEDDLFLRWRWHIPLLHARGALALREEQYDEAWRFATESLDMATQTSSRKHMARAQRLQGEILLARGRPEDAMQMLQTSIHLAEQIGTPREVWLGKATLGKELRRRNQDNEAEAQLSQAVQTIEAIVADLRTPRWRESLLNAAPVVELYNTLGRRPPSMTI